MLGFKNGPRFGFGFGFNSSSSNDENHFGHGFGVFPELKEIENKESIKMKFSWETNLELKTGT